MFHLNEKATWNFCLGRISEAMQSQGSCTDSQQDSTTRTIRSSIFYMYIVISTIFRYSTCSLHFWHFLSKSCEISANATAECEFLSGWGMLDFQWAFIGVQFLSFGSHWALRQQLPGQRHQSLEVVMAKCAEMSSSETVNMGVLLVNKKGK